mmetsp:Transcript_6216/g.9419  ORF Transcript_6216/g.9419 Transcript_6216/m.9419 type:complete len:563 (+) Transcript_6216:86-1774(+)
MAGTTNTTSPLWVTPWKWVTKSFRLSKKKTGKEGENQGNGNDNDASNAGHTNVTNDSTLKIEPSLIEIDTSATKCIQQRFPRTYAITFSILIPMLGLIGLCFLFGYGLASLEGPGELESNNQLIVDYIEKYRKVDNFLTTIERGYDGCIRQYLSSDEEYKQRVGLEDFVSYCTQTAKTTVRKEVEQMKLEEGEATEFSFDWMKCYVNEETGSSMTWEQRANVYFKWLDSYEAIKTGYMNEGKSEPEAHNLALTEADGSEDCFVNVAGGATFWFTIMTTIGYGNTAPATNEGRLLVYFMGFLSILLFSAVMGHAGSVLLTIVDDWFNRVGLKRLTQGIVAAIFWLIVLLLWMLLIATIYWLYAKGHFGQYIKLDEYGFLLDDAYWYAFISVTTIGFGDYYLAHDTVRPRDMFYNPLIMLMGFVILANFLLKFSELFIDSMKSNAATLDNNMKSLVVVTDQNQHSIYMARELQALRDEAAMEEQKEEEEKKDMPQSTMYDLSGREKNNNDSKVSFMYDLSGSQKNITGSFKNDPSEANDQDDLSYGPLHEVHEDGVSFDNTDQS